MSTIEQMALLVRACR